MHTENLTILFVDIAGFTATTNRQSRRQNASLLQNFESLLKPQIKKFSGQLVKSIGDALLLSFRSPTDAMLCACRMQDRMAWYRAENPNAEPIVIRIAAHLGEVRVTRQDVFGEAVNLAARIEAVTPPGEIYLSEAVYLAMNKTEVSVSDVGLFTLDGFPHPLHLYEVNKYPAPALPFGTNQAQFAEPLRNHRQHIALSLTALALASAGWLFWPQQTLQPNNVLPTSSLASARYIAVDLTKINAEILSAEYQFGLVNAVMQAIEQVPSAYPAEANAGQLAAEHLELHLKTAVYPKPPKIIIKFNNASTPILELEWNPELAETLLHQVTQTVTQQLGGQVGSAPPFTPLGPAIYSQWLKAEYLLSQAKKVSDPAALNSVIKLLEQGGDALQQYRPAQRTSCSAHNLLYQLTQQATTLERVKPQCLALAEPPASVTDLLVYGQYQRQRGKFEDAERALQQAIGLRPRTGIIYTELAQLYQSANLPLEAERVYQQAVLMQPNQWHAIQALAVFQLERGYLDSAVTNFKKVIQLLPQSANALSNLGSALLLQGQIQAAADTYLAALDISPEVSTQANLATIYYYLGRMPEAIALYQQALEQMPEQYQLHGNIADAYRQAGFKADALRHYDKALQLLRQQTKLNPREIALQAHYLSQTDAPLAASLMSNALQQDDKNAEIWLLNAMLRLRLGDQNAALNAVQQAIKYGFSIKLLAVEPDLAALAGHPDYQKLLQPTKGR